MMAGVRKMPGPGPGPGPGLEQGIEGGYANCPSRGVLDKGERLDPPFWCGGDVHVDAKGWLQVQGQRG